jgi:hypothetical protein
MIIQEVRDKWRLSLASLGMKSGDWWGLRIQNMDQLYRLTSAQHKKVVTKQGFHLISLWSQNMSPYGNPSFFATTIVRIRKNNKKSLKWTAQWHTGWPPLWSSGQSSCLLTQRSRVPFSVLQDFLGSSGCERGPLNPCEDKWGATWNKSRISGLENWD